MDVVAGILFSHHKRVLVAQKSPTKIHSSGLWEFPGGKVEAGETHHQALVRELKEELQITIGPTRFCDSIASSDGLWNIHFYLTQAKAPTLPNEHLSLAWLSPTEDWPLELCETDKKFINLNRDNVLKDLKTLIYSDY